MPDDAAAPDPAVDLRAAIERLRTAKPHGWIDAVADAVVDIGGHDAGDLLSLSADRAAAGYPADDGDPEAALAALEADLADDRPTPSISAAEIDLLADLPPARPPRDDGGHRDMGN